MCLLSASGFINGTLYSCPAATSRVKCQQIQIWLCALVCACMKRLCGGWHTTVFTVQWRSRQLFPSSCCVRQGDAKERDSWKDASHRSKQNMSFFKVFHLDVTYQRPVLKCHEDKRKDRTFLTLKIPLTFSWQCIKKWGETMWQTCCKMTLFLNISNRKKLLALKNVLLIVGLVYLFSRSFLHLSLSAAGQQGESWDWMPSWPVPMREHEWLPPTGFAV